jgi:MFS superfamily sulfate permease-like transporter
MRDASEVAARTPIGYRVVTHGLSKTMVGVTKKNYTNQILAGVALLAIAIPEQLATSQLAGVPAFFALIAFITATLVFILIGSNPIVSVGADSTIAPLFAVALVRLAPEASSTYMELVAATALVTGIFVLAIGVLRLGWLADFLSLPIVTGFLAGIGLIIIAHQLPHALGIPGGGNSFIQRVQVMSHQLGAINGWSVAISVGTLAVMVGGERINPKMPWALAAVVLATVVASVFSLQSHGVEELGTVTVAWPTWRLHWLTSGQWGVVVTTAITLVVVIISQTAATARTSV